MLCPHCRFPALVFALLIVGQVASAQTTAFTYNVGIGNTMPADRLHVGGELRVNACVKNSAGTGIAGACPSDVRFKRDITPFPLLLDKLVRLRPVNYYWRSKEYPDRHFGSEPSYGLIAQEVEQVLPELISTDEQGYKAVNYSKLPLLTLQAVKELKAENDTLKQMLNAQQAQISTTMNLPPLTPGLSISKLP